MKRNPLSLFVLLSCLLAGALFPAFGASAEDPATQDQGERLQALQPLQALAPALLGKMLSYFLCGIPIEAHGTFAADVAIDCPLLAVHVRSNLAGSINANPSLAQLCLQWLKLNGPVGLAASLAIGQITPEMLDQLGTEAPGTLDKFLAWLSTQAPEMLGTVAQNTMKSAGGSVTEMLLVVARKYPRVAARAVGALTRYCPQLLPSLMRLLVQHGPAPTP